MMNDINITLVLNLVAIILSSLSLIIGTIALAKIIGLNSSTHSVQLMPVDPEIDKINQQYTKEWATSDKAIKEEMNMYKEDIEDNMNQFSETKLDKEIFSL